MFGGPLICIFTLAFALAMHESGHALAVLLTGGKVADIVLFSLTPHVVALTAPSDAAEAFRAAAGSGLTLLIAAAAQILQRGAGYTIRRMLELFSLVEMTGWAMSLAVPDGSENDAAIFLAHSGLARGEVILFCGAIALLGVTVVARRTPASASQVPAPQAVVSTPAVTVRLA